jgi:hypothetical protein
MNRALPPGDSGHQIATSGRPSGHGGPMPGTFRLVGRVAAHPEGAETAFVSKVIQHGGFARIWRETPCATAVLECS